MKTAEAILQMRNAIRLRHLSLSTEETYCGWLGKFCEFAKTLPESSSEQRFEVFLTEMARRGVSASTQNQAFNAVLFFYRNILKKEMGRIGALRAKRPTHVRIAPSVDDVRHLLGSMEDLHGYPTQLIAKLLYGCGMRVCEPLNLRVKDVLIAQSRIVLRGAKGGKDRIVPIPCSLIEPLKQQIRFARLVWEKDFASRIPVTLPGLLEKKYPQARFAWQWFWLFPAHDTCAHPRTREIVRWRCHEANVQRSVKAAAAKHGLCITPHQLRHAYATHAVRAGANVRDVQESLGHSQINTTMVYLTPVAAGVPSPLESL